ncbi:MAG: hypothetical protein K9J06_14985 [Flavobacteriales bacterium]|nr:hypothetical protein [Flavobacteriales bacterium]
MAKIKDRPSVDDMVRVPGGIISVAREKDIREQQRWKTYDRSNLRLDEVGKRNNVSRGDNVSKGTGQGWKPMPTDLGGAHLQNLKDRHIENCQEAFKKLSSDK